MARILILGGGFGGIGAAVRLRQRLADDGEIVIVDRDPEFVMGLRKIWEIVGDAPLSGGVRRRAALERHRISVRIGTVEAIDVERRSATVDGERLAADIMIVALGAVLTPDAVPGLTEYGIDAWDREQAAVGRHALETLVGDRIVVGVFGTPYACPPAPYELALRIADRHRHRSRDAAVTVFTPTPIALPVLGPEQSGRLERLLAERGVTFRPDRQARAVEPGVVHFSDGEALAYDLLFAVSPHRVPSVLIDAGLADAGGWVAADRLTLETRYPGVYAIGDCTGIPLPGGLAIPKAGATAQVEGELAAEHIAASILGKAAPDGSDVEAVCFAEVGRGEAASIRARLFGDAPEAVLSDPSVGAMDHKRAFETERLHAWFGG